MSLDLPRRFLAHLRVAPRFYFKAQDVLGLSKTPFLQLIESWTVLSQQIADFFTDPNQVEFVIAGANRGPGDITAGAKAVFNLVPSLLEQIVDYASGKALDPVLVRGQMAPSDMAEEDRHFILENFFSANRQRMIEPNRRYLQLLYLAGDGDSARTADRVPKRVQLRKLSTAPEPLCIAAGQRANSADDKPLGVFLGELRKAARGLA